MKNMKSEQIKEAKSFNYANGQNSFVGNDIKVNLCDPRFHTSNSWTYQLLEKEAVYNVYEEKEIQEWVIVKEANSIKALFA